MSTLKTFLLDLHDDEDGASFLEYTVLLGIILAVSIAVIMGVGTWAGQVWTYVCTTALKAIPGTTVAQCAAAA